jgi:transposase-like protein
MAKAINYTPELTAQIVDQYQGGISVEDIAASIEKSVRSVRSKLVREGVYVAQPKATARKSDEPTKKELLNELETVYPFDVNGLTGATKDAIKDLLTHFQDA